MNDKSIKILVLCLLIFGLFLGAYESVWRQGAKRVTSNELSLNREFNEVYLEIIWDASGSMWGRDYGIEKIIKSKEVLKTFAAEIDNNINLGLRIFGARRVGDLEDSFLALPFNRNNTEAVINFIANVKPLGKSPIAYSLKKAVEDLTAVNGQKYIMLVSDGIDNGDIPPKKVVKELRDNNIILHVVHIGKLENDEIQNRLKEMVSLTGGNYYTYHNHKQIIPTFKQ